MTVAVEEDGALLVDEGDWAGAGLFLVTDGRAERGGFEPPEPLGSAAFKAAAFVHSATVPRARLPITATPTTLDGGEADRGTLRGSQERCQSGRMGRPAKALIVVTRSVGSNPTLSAR